MKKYKKKLMACRRNYTDARKKIAVAKAESSIMNGVKLKAKSAIKVAHKEKKKFIKGLNKSNKLQKKATGIARVA